MDRAKSRQPANRNC